MGAAVSLGLQMLNVFVNSAAAVRVWPFRLLSMRGIKTERFFLFYLGCVSPILKDILVRRPPGAAGRRNTHRCPFHRGRMTMSWNLERHLTCPREHPRCSRGFQMFSPKVPKTCHTRPQRNCGFRRVANYAPRSPSDMNMGTRVQRCREPVPGMYILP